MLLLYYMEWLQWHTFSILYFNSNFSILGYFPSSIYYCASLLVCTFTIAVHLNRSLFLFLLFATIRYLRTSDYTDYTRLYYQLYKLKLRYSNTILNSCFLFTNIILLPLHYLTLLSLSIFF